MNNIEEKKGEFMNVDNSVVIAGWEGEGWRWRRS